MDKVKAVKPLADYQLEVVFVDGSHGVLSLKERLFGPMFAPLKDQKLFSQVVVDEFGVICWPNGADLAPETVYEKLHSVKV